MTTESERSYRRRLLATALPDEAKGQVLQECLEVLDQEFGNADTLKYSEVIARMERNLAKAEVNTNRLLGRILVLRRKGDKELVPDPLLNAPAGSSMGGGNFGGNAAPQHQVFNTLFGVLAKDAGRRGKLADLRQNLGQQAFSLGVGSDCVKTITAWAKGSGEPAIQGSKQELHKVVNFAFVWMCNAYGPVEADKVLVTAVRMAEALPEAFDCSPREFL